MRGVCVCVRESGCKLERTYFWQLPDLHVWTCACACECVNRCVRVRECVQSNEVII